MAYIGLVSELPFGRAGMVAHENRLLSDPLQLLDVGSVSFEDDHVQRQRGATLYDSDGLAPAVQFTATQPGAYGWATTLLVFLASGGTPAWLETQSDVFATDHAPAVKTETLNITGTSMVAGSTIVLTTEINNSVGARLSVTVSDTQGHTWDMQTDETLSLFFGKAVFTTALTSTLAAGVDSISVTWTLGAPSIVASIGISASEFENCGALDIALTPTLTDLDGVGIGTSINSDLSASPPTSLPALMVAVLFQANLPSSSNAYKATPVGFTERDSYPTSFGANTSARTSVYTRAISSSPVIVGLYDWFSGAVATVTGGGIAVTTVAGSTTVTGTSTTFTSYAPGDEIMISGEIQVIETITSNTVLDTVAPWRGSYAAVTTYYHRVGRRIITATSDGDVLKDEPITLTTGNLDETTLSSTLSPTGGPTYFVAGGKEAAANPRKLFIFTGVDPVKYLSGNGTSLSSLTSNPPGSDWSAGVSSLEQPIAGVIHQGRLAAWGNWTDPHRIYFSDPDDHADFNTAGVTFTVPMRSDIGDRIYCGISFNGVLFCWKHPKGILWLDDSDLDPTNWVIRVKSESLGCAPTPYAALAMDDDIIFMAANGSIHLMSAVDALGGTKASDLTHALGLDKWIRENVNLSRLDRVISIWNQHKKVAIFYVPSTNSTTNDLALMFDFGLTSSGGPVRFGWSTRDAATAAALRRPLSGSGPQVPLIGHGSNAYLLDQDTVDKNGAAYTTVIQTPHLDCSWIHPSYRYLRKQFDHLELVMEPSDCDGDITVTVYVDGTLKQTLTYDATLRRQKKRLHVGDGHTISIRATKTDTANMKLLSMLLYFHPTNEDQSR